MLYRVGVARPRGRPYSGVHISVWCFGVGPQDRLRSGGSAEVLYEYQVPGAEGQHLRKQYEATGTGKRKEDSASTASRTVAYEYSGHDYLNTCAMHKCRREGSHGGSAVTALLLYSCNTVVGQ